MSANDEYPWTQPVLSLMRDAVDARGPVIGHCLGGQMLARALGGTVSAQPGEGDRLGTR
jgi:GMP synthase-like glutamine amidotransferase